jgi:hypothetical protein
MDRLRALAAIANHEMSRTADIAVRPTEYG